MSCEAIFPALLYDPILIWSGLIIFSATLFTIPVFLSKVTKVIITILASAFYTTISCVDYILPSKNQLQQQAGLTLEEKEENRLYLTLRGIGGLFDYPGRIIAALKNDLTCTGSNAATIIRYKFKSVFLILATAIVTTSILFTPIGIMSGVAGICDFLFSAGLSLPIAQYGACFIIGALFYSARTFIVGLGLLLAKACCGRNFLGQDDEDRPDVTPSRTPSGNYSQGRIRLRESKSDDSLLFSQQRRYQSDVRHNKLSTSSSRLFYNNLQKNQINARRHRSISP